MPESTTKGIFLKNFVKAVEEQKGPQGIAELKKLYGDIAFSGFKDYPYATERRLSKAIMQVLWGKETSETWEKMGELGFDAYVGNPIGKTMFSLFGGDMKRMAFMIEKVFETVTSGYNVHVEDLGERKIKITIDDCPDEKEYWVGLLKAAVVYFGYIPSIESKTLGTNNYEYIVAWV